MNSCTHKLAQNPNFFRTRMSGFSMIEMMISITIGLVIIAALVGVLTSASGSNKTNDRTTALQSNGRYALDHLKRELRHAEFRAFTWVKPDPSAVIITNECLVTGATAGSFVNNLSQGIWGANNANPFAASCMGTGYLRGDVLVVRRLTGEALIAPTALVANEIYFRSTFIKGQMFMAVASAVATTGAPQNVDNTPFGVPLADFLVQEYVYYIGSDDNNATTPALRRRALRAGTMADEMVVSGIEQMQVQYGRTPLGANTTEYSNADAITPVAQWEDVSSVRIWLLARHSQAETGYTNTQTYPMGDVTYDPIDDGFVRQLFSTVVQLRNFHNK